MKKLVIKTVCITLAIMIAFTSIVYLVVARFAPSMLGDFYFRLNNGNLTLKYTEIAYNESNDIKDLDTLCKRSIIFDNDEMVVTYATKLINREDYLNYVATQSKDYNYYIVCSLVQSLYQTNKKDVALQTAITNTNAYTTVNPIRIVISLAISDGDGATLQTIKQHLLSLNDESALISHDISWIENYFN